MWNVVLTQETMDLVKSLAKRFGKGFRDVDVIRYPFLNYFRDKSWGFHPTRVDGPDISIDKAIAILFPKEYLSFDELNPGDILEIIGGTVYKKYLGEIVMCLLNKPSGEKGIVTIQTGPNNGDARYHIWALPKELEFKRLTSFILSR